MSLILEALKRSEAERQLGQAPGLTTQMRTGRKRVSPHLWWTLALMIVLLGSAFLAWRWQSAPGAAPQVGETAIDAPQPARVDRSAQDANASSPGPAPADLSAAGPKPAATGAAQSSAARVPDPGAAPSRETAEFVSIERESAPVPVVPPPQINAPAGIAAAASEPATASTSSTSASVREADVAPVPALPRKRDLIQSERDALPPLKLSMHVYTESVEARFVLIDGRRYEEGEVIAPSLVVEEIRRDGAVLNFNQKRFLLPRP